MSDSRTFVSSLIEGSLGLVRGTLDDSALTDEFVARFSGVFRGAPQEGFPEPVFEESMREILAGAKEKALATDGYFVRKARWPGGVPFAVCLTHDVDNVSRPRSHLWKARARFSLGDLLAGLLGLGNPYDNVGLIASRERENGYRSSFYFLTSNYPLARQKKVADQIRSGGWEVGLHGDFGTHDSLEKMKEAVSKFTNELGAKPTGLREHYLKFDFSKSWEVMDEAGFEYDTTVGNNDRLGFKLGFASPFNPPDADWNPMDIIELPLTLMDTTLWGYLKRTEDQGYADFLAMLSSTESVEGLFTLLWHQEAVRMKGGRIYWRLLHELESRKCYVGNGEQVARWWKDRSIPLVRDGKLIRMEGIPPKDLVLELFVSEGRSPLVRSGSIDARNDGYVVRPTGPDFQLEVD